VLPPGQRLQRGGGVLDERQVAPSTAMLVRAGAIRQIERALTHIERRAARASQGCAELVADHDDLFVERRQELTRAPVKTARV